MTRVFVAECPLCHTKFESDPGACPVCGSAPLRAIREAVAAAEAIPEPTRRTLPPAALRRGAARPRRAFEGPKVRRSEPSKPGLPPRGPDGRFLPRKKAGGARPAPRVAHSAGGGRSKPVPALAAAEALRRAAGGTCAISPTSGGTTIRIDVRDAAARLREARRVASARGREYRRARAALREAREALSATSNRGTAIERALRRIAAWLEDLFV